MNAIPKASTTMMPFAPRPVTSQPGVADAYFAQVASYEQSRLRWAYRTAGIAWTVAIVAGLIAGASTLALAVVNTRPPPEPVAFRVNDTTGITDRLYDVRGGEMAASEAEQRHWLWQYVLHREGYSAAEAQYNFDVVNLMSTPQVQATYSDTFRGSNAQSPQVLFGSTGQVALSWISTSFIGPKLAQVRFLSSSRKGDMVLPKRTLVATVAYDFARGPISGSAININPRGFLVTSFRVDQENAQ